MCSTFTGVMNKLSTPFGYQLGHHVDFGLAYSTMYQSDTIWSESLKPGLKTVSYH